MAIELRDGGARAVILPEWGGRLHQLEVPIDGRPEPLLFAPADPEAYRERPTRGGSFPMAPWPNRVREGRFRWAGREYQLDTVRDRNAIHGLVHTQQWSVVARTSRVCELTCEFGEGWPWAGRAWQRFEIRSNALLMKLEVRAGREAFPAGCGWHPWFRRDVGGSDEVRLTVPAGRRYLLESQLPTGECLAPEGPWLLDGAPLGERRLDDCYAGLTGSIEIAWARLRLTMTVESTMPHAMVYTPAEAFCVEPQTCAPDAFNLADAGSTGDGMAIARPGVAVSIASEWRWEAD